jgi:DNA-binding NtrC family response regulator
MVPRLLLVDPDDEFRTTLAARLRGEGWEVVETDGPLETLALLEEQEVDVVLLDIRFSGAAGLDLLAQVRQAAPTTEVVLITPAGQVDLSIGGMRLGAFDDIQVPFDIKALSDRIREARRLKMSRKEEPRQE